MSGTYQSRAVCNTGPLIGLARIGLESLPFQLFPSVVVPEEVRRELLAQDSPDRRRLEKALGLGRIHPTQTAPDPLLATELGQGEAAVIAAALSLGIPTVVLDDRKARRIASTVFGLKCLGTAGMLVEAKARGLVAAVKPCLDGMIAGGYFLGPSLISACLDAAGEA